MLSLLCHLLGCQTETHGCSIPKVLCSAKSAKPYDSHLHRRHLVRLMPKSCIPCTSPSHDQCTSHDQSYKTIARKFQMTGLCACLCRLPCREHRNSKQKLKKSTTPLCFHQAHLFIYAMYIYGMSTGRQLNLKCPGRRSRTCSVQSQVSEEKLSARCHSTDLPHELSVLPRHAPMPAICTKVS